MQSVKKHCSHAQQHDHALVIQALQLWQGETRGAIRAQHDDDFQRKKKSQQHGSLRCQRGKNPYCSGHGHFFAQFVAQAQAPAQIFFYAQQQVSQAGLAVMPVQSVSLFQNTSPVIQESG